MSGGSGEQLPVCEPQPRSRQMACHALLVVLNGPLWKGCDGRVHLIQNQGSGTQEEQRRGCRCDRMDAFQALAPAVLSSSWGGSFAWSQPQFPSPMVLGLASTSTPLGGPSPGLDATPPVSQLESKMRGLPGRLVRSHDESSDPFSERAILRAPSPDQQST
jgi:hypothetical protein